MNKNQVCWNRENYFAFHDDLLTNATIIDVFKGTNYSPQISRIKLFLTKEIAAFSEKE